jgi:hypothetical protein
MTDVAGETTRVHCQFTARKSLERFVESADARGEGLAKTLDPFSLIGFGIGFSLLLMLGLPLATRLRLFVWLVIGPAQFAERREPLTSWPRVRRREAGQP